MKIRILALLLLVSPAFAQYVAFNGQCAKGGQAVITQGMASNGTKPLSGGVVANHTGVVASYPSCLVTVYLTGTITQASIYSSSSGGVITQPFTANADGSYLFYVAPGVGIDITITGGGLPSPVTLTDVIVGGGGGGGGSGTVTQVNTSFPIIGGPITTVGTVGLTTSCTANQVLAWSGSAWVCTNLTNGSVTGTGTVGTLPEWGTTTSLINSPLKDTGGSLTLTNPGDFGDLLLSEGSITAINTANDGAFLCGSLCTAANLQTSYSGAGLSGTLNAIHAQVINTSGTTSQVLGGQFISNVQSGAVTTNAGISILTTSGASNSGSVANQYGLQVTSIDQGNSTFLITANKGIDVTTGIGGGSGTGGLTNDYSLYVETPGSTGTGIISNHTGIYIADQGANNFGSNQWYALFIAAQTAGSKPTPQIGFGGVNFYSGSGAPTLNCGTTPSVYWRTDAPSTATQQYGCTSGTSWTAFTTGAGSGTVTSVAQTINGTSPSGIFTVTGSPVTTAGTLNINLAGTSGGIPYFSSGTVLSPSAALGSGQFVLGGGAGASPTTSFSIVPTANGGTGINTSASTGVAQVTGGTWTVAALPLASLATQAPNTVVMNATGGTALPTAVAMPTCTGATSADIYDTTSHTWVCNSTSGLTGLTTGVITQAGSSTTIINSSPQLDNNLSNANELTYAGTGIIINPAAAANGQIGLTGTGGTTETMTVNAAGTLISFSNGMLASNVTDSALTNGNCVQAGVGGILTSSGASCAASPVWSSLLAPTATLTLPMYQSVATSYPTTIVYGNATGSGTMFNIADSLNNTGTGAIFDVATSAGSSALPVQFTAQGLLAGVKMDTTGLLQAIGAGGINATKVNSNTYPASGALNSGAVLCTTGASTVSFSSTLALNNFMVGGGAGACPSILAQVSYSAPTVTMSPNQVSGTGSTLTLSPTWNNGASVFDAALTIKPTDTASAAGSLLIHAWDGATQVYSLDKGGNSTQYGVATFSPAVRAFAGLGAASYFVINAPADTGITAATESIGVNHVGATRTWSDGTTTTQREYFFGAPTYNKTTSAATFTKAATLAIDKAPVAGAGVTLTNAYALWVQAGLAQFDGGLNTTAVNDSGLTASLPVCTDASKNLSSTCTGLVPIAALATVAANTTIANVTGSTASPTAASIPAGIQNYVSGTGYNQATSHQVTLSMSCADSSGSGTAQVCNTSPTFTPAPNDCIIYTTTTANTGAGLTLNVNSLGAKSVAKWLSATTLAANDVLANKQVLTCYDGTNWELHTIGNAPVGAVTSVNTLTGAVVIEAATSGQMAVSGGSGAALTGAADMTYTTHTFATTTAGIFDWTAATGAGAIKLPPVVGGTSLAGTSTANLSSPIVIQNTNSSNNNTSITMGITAPGTSTGQTVLNVNGASTGGDLQDWGTGGTWASGVLSGQTLVAAVTPTGAFVSKGTTAGFIDFPQGSTSSAVSPCNVATSICIQAPTSVTSYLLTMPGAAPAVNNSLKVTSTAGVESYVATIPAASDPNAGIRNFNQALQSQVVVSGTEYYITRSDLDMPAVYNTAIAAGTTMRWHVQMAKTAAGTGSFQVLLKKGTNGTTADTSIVTQTVGATQTAVADNLTLDITLTWTSATAAYWSISPRQLAASAAGFGLVYPAVALDFNGTISAQTTTTASDKYGISIISTTGTPTITVSQVQAQAYGVN